MPNTPGAALDGLRATLGGVDLGTVDADGVAWRLQTLDGWDSPDSRSEMTDREGDHGAWAGPVYLGARPITLGGTIVAPSQAALEEAMERLRMAAGLTDTLLTVWETVPKQALVRRSGKPLMQYVTDTTATYSVMVTAGDPRRYGIELQDGSTGLPSSTGGLTPPVTPPAVSTAVTVSGEITAPNRGTVETRPVFVIDGPATRPEIVIQMPDGKVRFLTYSQSLLAGDQLVIDVDAKSCMLNGNVSRRRFLSIPAGWPIIPAKSVVTVQFRAALYNPDARLSMRWRSAWM
ncbi:phage distal tail protein [Streptomyces sp. NPDC088337]|uniref:phage distal tail protein n=1 Tax=unclassified Streptomyces TaxID=2593676 RepID=UPI003800CF16